MIIKDNLPFSRDDKRMARSNWREYSRRSSFPSHNSPTIFLTSCQKHSSPEPEMYLGFATGRCSATSAHKLYWQNIKCLKSNTKKIPENKNDNVILKIKQCFKLFFFFTLKVSRALHLGLCANAPITNNNRVASRGGGKILCKTGNRGGLF